MMLGPKPGVARLLTVWAITSVWDQLSSGELIPPGQFSLRPENSGAAAALGSVA